MQERLTLTRPAERITRLAVLFDLRDVPSKRLPALGHLENLWR